MSNTYKEYTKEEMRALLLEVNAASRCDFYGGIYGVRPVVNDTDEIVLTFPDGTTRIYSRGWVGAWRGMRKWLLEHDVPPVQSIQFK